MFTIEQTDTQLKGTQAGIRYTLGFTRAGLHLVDIRMEVDTDTDTLTFTLPVWIPGSYKLREFVSNLNDLRVYDHNGSELPYEWITKNSIRVQTHGASTVELRYNYYHGTERSVRFCHIDRTHAFINPANCLFSVEGRTNELHHVRINNPWKSVSTALSPVRRNVWGALNYDILVDSPIEIGNHYTASFTMHGARHEVAITGSGEYNADEIVENVKSIVDAAVRKMWGSLPYQRYVFMIQFVPNMYGGLEHAFSSVNMFDPNWLADPEGPIRLYNLLCHEFFHTWNVKRIRPVEFGPFDYNRENYTRMLWLAEGVTTYYDKFMTMRSGFLDRRSFLPYVAKHVLTRHFDVPGRKAMSLADSSFLAWVKFYMMTPDSENRFPHYYITGATLTLLLDIDIITGTNGRKTLDDVMLALMERYYAKPERGITEAEFLRTVKKVTGLDLADQFRTWLYTTEEMPVAEYVKRIGLRWVKRSTGQSTRYLGVFTETTGNRLIVTKVRRDSPAEMAGIGAGDEIIALNGMCPKTQAELSTIIQSAGDAPIILTGASNGILYTTTVANRPLAQFDLIENANADPQTAAYRERWFRLE